MPLPGGATDKIGNRFELRWTLKCIAEILHETADSIYLEPPGVEGVGVEFILKRGVRREFHQVKRQTSQSGRWSLAAMHRESILSNFWNKLCAHSNNECHFISISDADELRELSQSARDAKDFLTFQNDFLNKSKKRASSFDEIIKYWSNCSKQDAYIALKRVFVDPIGEEILRSIIEFWYSASVDASPDDVVGLLSTFVLDQIHHELRAYDFWQFLHEKGIHRRSWNNDPRVLAAVESQNARYFEPLKRDAIIANNPIPRSEVAEIATALKSHGAKQGVLVSGEAGVGKSGVGLQIADNMQKAGWPVLAFRIDQLETMQSPKDVGRQLELPESPVTVLANLAQNKPCLLVIDQLDAISKASGRNTHFFDCIDEMIRQAKLHKEMRVVLLCRKFDIDNDDRLRRLIGDRGFAIEISVGRIIHEVIVDVVTTLGLDASLLSPKQLEILSIPLHLKLLSEVASSQELLAIDFKTVNDLYKLFWKHKQSTLSKRLGRDVEWNSIIYALCDKMSTTQRLIAPKIIVEAYEADAEAMVSERVLIADGSNYRFFHETFFDYAFARRFLSTDAPLLSLLLEDEQHLFRRAQVRQILALSRDVNRDAYLSDVAALLSSQSVRFHIKQTIFALLRQITDPTEQEWEIIAPYLDEMSNPLYGEAWQLLTHTAWFQVGVSLGVIEKWLSGEDVLIDQTIRMIAFGGKDAQDDVANLLEGRDTSNKLWQDRLIFVFSWIKLGKSRRLFDLFLRLLRQGILDEIRAPIASNGDFWLLIDSLAEEQPEWYCEVLGAYLTHHLELNLSRGINDPFESDSTPNTFIDANDQQEDTPRQGTIIDTQFSNSIITVAQKASVEFAKQVFDFIIQVAERNAFRKGTPPFQDCVWPWRSYGEVYGLKAILLQALELALKSMASSAPEALAPYIDQLRASDTETAQYLLVRTYTANGQLFADDAVAYLSENSKRLQTGWSDEPHWATRLLIESITPYCSESSLAQLEDIILRYYTDYERSVKSYQKGSTTLIGYPQFVLLNGIEPGRRSGSVQRRIAEWERKFQIQDGTPAQGM